MNCIAISVEETCFRPAHTIAFYYAIWQKVCRLLVVLLCAAWSSALETHPVVKGTVGKKLPVGVRKLEKNAKEN